MGKTEEMGTEYGSLQYEIMEDGVRLTGYRGKDVSLVIPEQMAGKPVRIVGKKVFLGAKGLGTIVLPESVEAIGDWAFASCSNLKAVTLPRKMLAVGQGIFKDCVCLQQILLSGEKEPDISYLLAAAMNKLDAFYLFDPLEAGSIEWLSRWDARMLSLLGQKDEEGFSKMLLCGEEDYGSRENNLDYYIGQRKRFKVRLTMLRLMHDIGLPSNLRDRLLGYLRVHTKGESSEETWKVVLEEHGDDRQYYQFLLDSGCITDKNLEAALEDMGESHTEMKAFLMNAPGMRGGGGDVFARLEFGL